MYGTKDVKASISEYGSSRANTEVPAVVSFRYDFRAGQRFLNRRRHEILTLIREMKGMIRLSLIRPLA